MDIRLNNDDLNRMPSDLYAQLLNWLKTDRKQSDLSSIPHGSAESRPNLEQLTLNFEGKNQVPEQKGDHSHVKLTQLFDAGITKRGMAIRIKLKRDLANKKGRSYSNNLEISSKGTIVYEGKEFDKPSPLAAKVNGSQLNGWEYIEIKKNDQWIRLEELRKIWKENYE